MMCNELMSIKMANANSACFCQICLRMLVWSCGKEVITIDDGKWQRLGTKVWCSSHLAIFLIVHQAIAHAVHLTSTKRTRSLTQVAEACLIFTNVTIFCNCYKYLILLQVALVASHDVFDAPDAASKQEQHITGTDNLQAGMQPVHLLSVVQVCIHSYTVHHVHAYTWCTALQLCTLP